MEQRAGFWIRFFAGAIDSIVISVALFVLILAFGGVVGPETNAVMTLMISLILSFFYYVRFQTKNNGQTFGKKIAGIRVVTLHSEPVTVGKMFLREIIGKTISAFILLIGFFMAAGKSKRALHDYLAKTIVIRVNE